MMGQLVVGIKYPASPQKDKQHVKLQSLTTVV